MSFAFQFRIRIRIREQDGASNFTEIDNFRIDIPFPPNIQEQEYTGEYGIANVTLSTDVMCTEADACNSTVVVPQFTGTVYILATVATFTTNNKHMYT